MMSRLQSLQNRIFNITSQTEFLEIALEVFNYQYNGNRIYRLFIQSLGKEPSEVDSLHKIPFLPVEFFRNHKILTGNHPVEMVFESSGTTGYNSGEALCQRPEII